MASDGDATEQGDEEMTDSPNEKKGADTYAQKEEEPSNDKSEDSASVEYVQIPHPHDILSGRGNGANQHPGNIFFRCLIQRYKHRYIHTGPSEKKAITKRIVDDVFSREPPGRFLKQCNESEEWEVLDYEKVLKKTGQALREKAPELKRKSLEEANFLLHRSIIQNGMERPLKKPNLGLDLLASQKQAELAQMANTPNFNKMANLQGFQSGRMMSVPPMPHQMRRMPHQADHLTWDEAASRASKRKFNELNAMNPPIQQNGFNGNANFKMPPPSPATSARVPHQQGMPYSNAMKPHSPHSSVFSMQPTLKHPPISLNHNDVIVGRTEKAKSHAGNVRFRELVGSFKAKYNYSSTVEKMQITKLIIDKIVDRNPQGRFLKFKNGRWEPVAIDIVIEQTNEALRDHSPELRRPTPKKSSSPVVSEIKHVLQKPIVRKREMQVETSPLCVREDVNVDGRSSDPPGSFYNYYSTAEVRDQDVKMENDTHYQRRDPPGELAKDLKKNGITPMKISPNNDRNERSPTEVNDLSGFDTERLNHELQRRQRQEHAVFKGHSMQRPTYVNSTEIQPRKKLDPPV